MQEQAPGEAEEDGRVETDEATQEQAPVEAEEIAGVENDEAAQDQAPGEEAEETAGVVETG